MWNQTSIEQDNILKTSLLLALKDKGVKSITINFSGSGDSGDIDEIEYTDNNGHGSWNQGYQADNPGELEDKIRDAFFDFVDNEACKHGDWVNNEGGYGTMTIDTDSGEWELDYNQRTTEDYISQGQNVFTESLHTSRY